MAWKIYYDDGTTFSAADGAPHEAPPLGFIVAVGYDETGSRYLMSGWDHYFYDPKAEQWWGSDRDGWLDRSLHSSPSYNRVYAHKLGRTVTRSRYRELMERADQDPDFPQDRR